MTVSGWTKRYLGELVTIQGGFAFKSADFVDDGVPIVRMSDLDNGRLNLDRAARIPEQKLKYLSNFALNDGDFLVGMSGSIENYAIVRKKDLPAYLNQRVGRFRLVNDELADYDFITQVARSDSYKLHVGLLSAGAAQLNISPTQIESYCFDVPPKPEQTKIAEVLSTVDLAIEQTEALIVKQQRIKTGLMQDLLTRGIDEHGNLRSEETHQFKDLPLRRIPVEWEERNFFDCVSISEGQRNPTQKPYRDWTLVAPDHIESKTGLLISQKTAREQGAISGKYEFSPGDIIYSKIRPYLRKAVLVDFSGLCSADMYPLKPKNGVISEFIFAIVLGERFSQYAESVSERSGFPKINRSELSEYQVALPSEEEQDRIATITKQLSNSLAIENATFAKLRSLKSALMQDLLKGKVSVASLLTEPQEASA